jgi:hypothetical protein
MIRYVCEGGDASCIYNEVISQSYFFGWLLLYLLHCSGLFTPILEETDPKHLTACFQGFA